MLNIPDVHRISQVLEAMQQYELSLSAFYAHCAGLWEEDRAFWAGLSQAEQRHGENIEKIRGIIAAKPGNFDMGRPFNLAALRTALDGLEGNRSRIMEGAFPKEKLLILARDIEQSILESHYAEIVKTADLEYLTLMSSILSQTEDHKMVIQKKIDSRK